MVRQREGGGWGGWDYRTYGTYRTYRCPPIGPIGPIGPIVPSVPSLSLCKQHRCQIAHEVLAARRVVFDVESLAIRLGDFLHEVVAGGGLHAVGAHADRQQQLALLEADAMADQPHCARSAQRVVAALAGELRSIRQRLRLADHERAGHHIAEAAAQWIDDGGRRGNAVEGRHEIDDADDVA